MTYSSSLYNYPLFKSIIPYIVLILTNVTCQTKDLFGPCKTSNFGNKYVPTMTTAFTKYTIIVTIPNKAPVTVAAAVFFNVDHLSNFP